MKKWVLAVLVSTSAHAEPRVELGLALGGHAFSRTNELGANDNPSDPGPVSSSLVGVRAAVPVTTRLAVEGEAMIIPTKDDVLGRAATVFGVRAHVRFDLLTGRLRPFLVAGYGMHAVSSSSPQLMNDVDQAYHWGGGVRYALGDRLDVRIDARHLIVPDRTFNGATSEYEVTAGIAYRFGHHAPPPPPPAPSPPPAPAIVEAPPPPPPPAPEPAPPVIEELAGIQFRHDSAVIDDASAPILDRAVEWMRAHPAISIEISGHTSSEGDRERNLALSLRRAEAVKAYLVKHGVDDARVMAVGHGSDDPIADNATDEGRRKNRRIEFRIVQPSELP